MLASTVSHVKVLSNFTPGPTTRLGQTNSLTFKFFRKGHPLRNKGFLSTLENLSTFSKQVHGSSNSIKQNSNSITLRMMA